ncbi:MAG: hypothetical protein IIZ92_10575 [Aquincola sp.]|nr:hypothetical protein [Aquincola sp.]|tara:strand:- start:5565 stop:5924 length:360 start_codon:yes stop_codon:yes gene_type:complete
MDNEALSASIQYVGLYVHKDSIDIATADEGRRVEVRHAGQIGGDLAALDKALRRLVSRRHRLHVVYEAGPCGFVIARHLASQGRGLHGGGTLVDPQACGRPGQDRPARRADAGAPGACG